MSHAPNQSATEEEGNEVAPYIEAWKQYSKLSLQDLELYLWSTKQKHNGLCVHAKKPLLNIINHFIKQKQ